MVRERRAMPTTSASRSSRSTVMTMSAASEDAVAPRAPIATPDVRHGQRRRVVDAVADHHDRLARVRPLDRDGIDLVRRRPLGEDGVDADRRRRRSRPPSAWSPVTITIRVKPVRRSARIARGVSGRIGSSRTSAPGDDAVDRHEDVGGALDDRPPPEVARPGRQRPARRSRSRREPTRDRAGPRPCP